MLRSRPARFAVALAVAVAAGCAPDGPPPAGGAAVGGVEEGRAAEGGAAAPDVPGGAAEAGRVVGGEAVVGQTVYVPAYSHIFHQDGTRELDLTTTLSVRNTDPERAITVASVGYYDSGGRRVRGYAERPFQLGPLSSEAFVVEARDRTGGVGATFLVEWEAAAEVSPPIVEAVMVSTAQNQGISLLTRGRVVRSLGGAAAPPDLP
ncbi:DUF3124 domain-containing protein [Rubrivirga sp. S365]|uniref:DUF3124 domain-containing protein n=1 Tax=Rubrivirga litoralis TaxID=3075598 RepID=A0ABU3BNH5_9BACT|nr:MULTISPECIES: DUF3124 domain-containing protein [unclassified Rubrivirga]MDT0630820.1 DUF3124 domain-containing protein [Rubrivirga sp. F394]MDT7857372.1 DUF3124 domain-containing protein [Rubrivirga sp. S365]